ncbi:hypothetical protein GCM10027589_18940 [Actinocorallia lasiicapitis]
MAHKGKILIVGLLLAGGTTTYIVRSEDATPTANFLDLPVEAADAEREADLVADEDARLNKLRSLESVKDKKLTKDMQKPYRVSTGDGYTLVLTAKDRGAAYTIADLVRYAPQTFVRQSDGSYLLSENIYLSGATLNLYNPGGLVLRMASSPTGFVSIISFGGRLRFSGSANAPTKVTSWDGKNNKPDLDPRDGRAYIRAIGGELAIDYTELSDLGFWSGRTGGVSATGTDRPNTGATVNEADKPEHRTKEQRHQDKKDRMEANQRKKDGEAAVPSTDDTEVLGTGNLPVPGSDAGTDVDTPAPAYANLKITRSRITGGAFGLFISGANGVQLSDLAVENSMVHGIVLHRFTSNGQIERTLSKGNRGDGFVISRAAHDIRITESTAEDNLGNGYTINGRPLAEGPSAAGESIEPFGNNTIQNSYSKHNLRYGVEVLGGVNNTVQNNEVTGSDMGIVVRQGARKVTVGGNLVRGPKRQGISIRDGVTDSRVMSNIIDKAPTGIYVRDAAGDVRSNSIENATLHGVTLKGAVSGSLVTKNTVTGSGPSAIDKARSHGDVTIDKNRTIDWHDTSSLWVQVKRVLSPLTLIWCLIILMLITSAVQERRRRKGLVKRGVNPYDKQVHLEERPVQELVRNHEAVQSGDLENGVPSIGPAEQNGTRERVLAE